MNKYLAAIYRNDSHSLETYISRKSAKDHHEINEALRSLLNNNSLEKTQRIRYVQALLLADANPDGKDGDGNPYLLKVCENQDVELANLLVNFECDVNATNEVGTTALHIAAKVGNSELAGLLINFGAYVSALDWGGETPLMVGIQSQPSEDLFNILLIDADVHAKNNDGETVLHMAVKCNLVKEAQVLIENGANVNQADWEGNRPLHYACMSEPKPQMVKLLLDSKCDPNVVSNENVMPVHWLSESDEQLESMQILLDHPAIDLEVSAPGIDGGTPLFIAVYDKAWEMVKQLLKAGSNPNTKRAHPFGSDLNREPYVLDVAVQYKAAHLVCALLLAGATKHHCLAEDIESALSPENWEHFNLQIHKPPSMKQLCRLAIRRDLGRRPDKKVYALDCLPSALKDYVAMTDLDSIKKPEPHTDEDQ